MTYIPDFTDMTLAGGDSRAELHVGWVGDDVKAPGPTSVTVLEALLHAKAWNQLPDGCLDSHDCEICDGANGHGHFFIEDTNCRYVLPNLVIHYITEHSYKLPGQVEEALLSDRRGVRLL